jgi:hypothetical protein
MYTTVCYPVVPDSVTISLDDVDLTDRIKSVSADGMILLADTVDGGQLKIVYTCRLNAEALQNGILLVMLNLIQSQGGGTLSSISEGDVSVSYDTAGSSVASLDALVANVRAAYGARVRMI